MIIFSKDYTGNHWGLTTKARLHDKWAHLAGSAALVIITWILLSLVALVIGTARILTLEPLLWVSTIIVWGGGLAYEIHQGMALGDWLDEHTLEGDRGIVEGWGDPPSDGFSWVDLVANTAGIALLWGFVMLWGVIG
jgi:hypothetical protein